MHLNDRIGLRLVAGTSLAALVACGGGSTSSSTPATTSSPAISQQPQDQTKVAGQTATFTVAALGNGTLSYQWQKDGANIPGATAAAYTTPALTASDAGAYACRVTNALNGSQVTLLSSAASLVVNTPPVISAQPASNPAITQGGTVSFSVVAKGNGTLSYQWQKNGLAIPASANASAVKATLVLSNLQPSDAGTYTCAVTATLNCTTTTTSSAPAVLGVGQLPTITTQPQAQQTVVQGGPASFTVVATPTSGGTLSYQWRKNGVDIPSASNASAATPTLALASAQGTDAGTYSCAVTNTASGTAGVLASTDAVLAVNVPPTVAPISGQTGGQGGSVTFTAVATANGALSYQWQKNGVDIPGATQAVLTLSNLQVSAADAYACVVTNTLNGTTTTTTASTSLAVNPGPTVAAVADQTVAEGGPASFTITASGAGSLSYQWRKNGAPIDSVANPSAATATLTLAAVTATDDQSTYSCVVTDTVNGVGAQAASNGATLSVARRPAFTTDVASQGYLVPPGTATFTAVATGNGTISYQWYQGTPGSGTPLAGQTAGTLSLSGLVAGDNGTSYYCVATNTLNGVLASATSAAGSLLLNAAPVIGTQPTGTTVLLGSSATFTVGATGTGALSYQWYKGTPGSGTAIVGATGASYTTPTTVKTDAGTYYCVVTNVVGGTSVTATSTVAILALNWAPTFNTQYGPPAWTNTSPGAVKQGGTVNMSGLGVPVIIDQTTAPNVGTVAYTYQWYKNGTPFTPAAPFAVVNNAYSTQDQGLKINAPGAAVSDGGSYTCVVTRTVNGTAAAQSAVTSPASLFVLATPVISSQPVSLTGGTAVTQSGTATFSVVASAANGTLYYQWYKVGMPNVPVYPTATNGANTGTLTLANVAATDSGSQYFCTVTNKDAVNAPAGLTNPVNSASAALSVNPVVAVPVVSLDANIPANQTGLVASTQDQGPSVTYAWSMTGGVITSATTGRSITYTAPASGSVTATVKVTSTVDATNQTGSATATVKGQTFVAPDIVVPPVAHPGDAWMKAFTTAYAGETYSWSGTGGTTTPTLIAGTASTPTLGFSISSSAANGTFAKLNVNGQLGVDNATTSAQVNVKTGVWVTKDGSTPTNLGEYPTATTLPNGRVLITGGQAYMTSSGNVTSAAAYVYDPATGRMVPTGTMNTSRARHTATLLANGTVLVTGGYTVAYTGTSVTTTYLATAELWDPLTGVWTPVGAMANLRALHNAVRLANGTVAILGGTTNGGTSGVVRQIEVYDPATQAFTGSGAWPLLNIGRYNAQVVQLTADTATPRALSDAGKFLIVGGQGTNGTGNTNSALWQPEVWDGTAAVPVKTAAMTLQQRAQHTATVLKDGNVLITGGSSSAATAELFSPGTTGAGTGTFTQLSATLLGGPTGNSTSAVGRVQHTANLLPDGSVLLAGGVGGFSSANGTGWSTELFVPSGSPTSSGSFTYGNATANTGGYVSTFKAGHYGHTSASLPTGQVVIAGGQAGNGAMNTTNLVELYTPASGSTPATITVPAGLDTGRTQHCAVKLGSGRVMVIGGVGPQGGSSTVTAFQTTYLDSVRIYDPATHTWITTGSLNIPRKDFAAVVLSNGEVLVTGGKSPLMQGETSAELWVPTANNGQGAWQIVPGLNTGRFLHSMVVLSDGRVLVMGGANSTGGLKSCEIYSGGVFTQLPSSTGDLSESKGYLSPVLITSGTFKDKVVIAGGRVSPTTGSSASAQVEVFDPATNSWNRNMTPLQSARSMHTTTLLPSGKLVLIGGMTTDGNSAGVYAGIDPATFQPVAGTATETYDLTLNGGTGGSVTWTGSATPYSKALFTADGHRVHQAVLITSGANSGKVLVMGGQGASLLSGTLAYHPLLGMVCELYDPATDTFTATDSLPSPRKYSLANGGDWNEFTATPLSTNSDILVIGGSLSGNSTHIYRP